MPTTFGLFTTGVAVAASPAPVPPLSAPEVVVGSISSGSAEGLSRKRRG